MDWFSNSSVMTSSFVVWLFNVSNVSQYQGIALLRHMIAVYSSFKIMSINTTSCLDQCQPKPIKQRLLFCNPFYCQGMYVVCHTLYVRMHEIRAASIQKYFFYLVELICLIKSIKNIIFSSVGTQNSRLLV